MTQHIDDIVIEWLSGALSSEREQELERHIASCPRCARELTAARQDFAALAASLKPVAPPNSLRARIFEDAHPEARFMGLVDRVAALTDLPRKRAQAYLASIDAPESWKQGLLPGMDIFHIDGGPAVEKAILGFIRLAPGAGFPEHEHHGRETTLVLQGSYRDADGEIYRYGQENQQVPGSSHALKALAGPPLIYLNVAFDGINIGPIFVAPNDPRL